MWTWSDIKNLKEIFSNWNFLSLQYKNQFITVVLFIDKKVSVSLNKETIYLLCFVYVIMLIKFKNFLDILGYEKNCLSEKLKCLLLWNLFEYITKCLISY